MTLKYLIILLTIIAAGVKAHDNQTNTHLEDFEKLVTEVATQKVLIDHLRLQLETLEDKCNDTLNRLPGN